MFSWASKNYPHTVKRQFFAHNSRKFRKQHKVMKISLCERLFSYKIFILIDVRPQFMKTSIYEPRKLQSAKISRIRKSVVSQYCRTTNFHLQVIFVNFDFINCAYNCSYEHCSSHCCTRTYIYVYMYTYMLIDGRPQCNLRKLVFTK